MAKIDLLKRVDNHRIQREQEGKLTIQFYKSLEADFCNIKDADDGQKSKHPGLFKRIEDLLADKREMTWENAYMIQQLMIPLYQTNTLEVELGKRLVEAEGTLSEKLIHFYTTNHDGADTEKKRALLKGLVMDIQWKDQIAELKRVYARLSRKSGGIVFVLTVALFVITVFSFRILSGRTDPLFETMSIAMSAGMMGAAFSMLIGMKERLRTATFDELKVQRRYPYLFSRTIIGLGASLILNFFMQAQLLTGSFFPKYIFELGKLMPIDSENMALLVVWSFIAGFSEKLVPNIISKAEQKVDVQ